MEALSGNNTAYGPTNRFKQEPVKAVLTCLTLTLFTACNIPPPDVSMAGKTPSQEAALEFSLGVMDNILGGETEAFLDAHAGEVHVVGDNEVYAPEDLYLSASVIEALPIRVASQAQNLITYHQNYEPRLVLLSEYLEGFDLEMGSSWNAEQESYVFLGNHLVGESRLPADHLFNFVITENEGDWSISGLLSE